MPQPVKTIMAARRLRHKMSLPEVLLWQILRRNGAGIKFRRQHPIGPYVIDFYAPQFKAAVEIDGLAHDMGNQPARDSARDAWLARQGLKIIRFPARDVLADAAAVADAIVGQLKKVA